jgi:hypothetical protein
LHRALYVPKSLVLLFGPALRQSQELFLKVLSSYRDLGRPVMSSQENRLSLELRNGSRIVSLPGSERTTRGFSGVDLVIVDEASRVLDELVVEDVRPMLIVSGGDLYLLSTPYGKRGIFYEIWNGDAGQGEEWERYEVAADMVSRILPEALERERKSRPARTFRQEYFCSFEETDDQVFSEEAIQRAFRSQRQPLDFSKPLVEQGRAGGKRDVLTTTQTMNGKKSYWKLGA